MPDNLSRFLIRVKNNQLKVHGYCPSYVFHCTYVRFLEDRKETRHSESWRVDRSVTLSQGNFTIADSFITPVLGVAIGPNQRTERPGECFIADIVWPKIKSRAPCALCRDIRAIRPVSRIARARRFIARKYKEPRKISTERKGGKLGEGKGMGCGSLLYRVLLLSEKES